MKWPIFAYNKRDRLREMRTRGREGVKNPENFAYVLNGSPLRLDIERGCRTPGSNPVVPPHGLALFARSRSCILSTPAD